MYLFIVSEKANHSIRLMCRVLQVSRSAYYAWVAVRDQRGRRQRGLIARIRGIHRRSRGTYGSPRVTASLRQEGLCVNHKRVARIMRQEGLRGVPKKRFRGSTTRTDPSQRVAPERVGRNFDVSEPNTVWVEDITYLRLGGGWAYLAVLIDLYSRKVVGWAVEDHMRTELVEAAFNQAVALRRPAPGLIHHTDRGAQYASDRYLELLDKAGVVQSMSRKANCWDNAVAESFFGTLEQELIQGRSFTSLRLARAEIGNYIHRFYNPKRLHSTLGFRTPLAVETQHQASKTEAA